MKSQQKPKLAIVYDRINKFGGAERVLLALHEVWPDAPLFTAVHDRAGAPWAEGFRVRASFMQQIPWARSHHEFFPWLTPMAFETFGFDEFDVVLSVTSAEAKSVLTKPDVRHICYCLTPTRYLWSGFSSYVAAPGMDAFNPIASRMLRRTVSVLRAWDLIGASRPDAYIAISQNVKKRIETFYHRPVADVIYPPCDTETFCLPAAVARGGFFLVVARLVSYKRLDILIDVFNTLGEPLVIIGNGMEYRRLRRISGPMITFITDHLTDEELVHYYQTCRGFIFAGDEDFGIAAVEAQASGTPVIAYRHSGMAEAVQDGKTGVLFENQTKESIIGALAAFRRMKFDSAVCRDNAVRFSTKTFQKNMRQFIESVVETKV